MSIEIEHESAQYGVYGRTTASPQPHIAPPHLVAVHPSAAPVKSPLTVANLRLPVDLVRGRAAMYADNARKQGMPHSMRLWRECYRHAIHALTRESANVGASASCEALFWEQKGGEYWVSATFAHGGPALLH